MKKGAPTLRPTTPTMPPVEFFPVNSRAAYMTRAGVCAMMITRTVVLWDFLPNVITPLLHNSVVYYL